MSALVPTTARYLCGAYVYVENLRRHVEQHHFLQDAAHRRALLLGSGRICCTSDGREPFLCGALHPFDGFPVIDYQRIAVSLSGSDCPLESRRRPYAVCNSILVIDCRENFCADYFLVNAGLQYAARFGRGKLCRLGLACPSPRISGFSSSGHGSPRCDPST